MKKGVAWTWTPKAPDSEQAVGLDDDTYVFTDAVFHDTVRARPGRLSTLRVSHSRPGCYGTVDHVSMAPYKRMRAQGA